MRLNCRVPVGTHGGVRGRLSHYWGSLLHDLVFVLIHFLEHFIELLLLRLVLRGNQVMALGRNVVAAALAQLIE